MSKFNPIKIIAANSQVLAEKTILADGFFGRLRGLMFRDPLMISEGIIIKPCKQIHTHFMGYPVDVLFLDKDFKICHIELAMQPWRVTKYVNSSRQVLELPVGTANSLQLGDQLEIVHN